MKVVVFTLLCACTWVAPSTQQLENSEISLTVLGGGRHPAGRNLLLRCDYSNGSAIPVGVGVSWEKDGALLNSTLLGNRVKFIRRQLASRAMIIMDSVVNDSGRYRCVVGGEPSPEVEITVVFIPEPYVNLLKKNFLCYEGDTLHIPLTTKNILGFRLLFREEDVGHLRYKHDSENATLTIYSIQLSDSGVWKVYGGNAVGFRIVTFNITVLGNTTSSVSQAATSVSPTSAPSVNVHVSLSDGTNVGLIVGATVGVSMGVLLIMMVLVIVWHRSGRACGSYTLPDDNKMDSITLKETDT